ncbi:MAG: alpha/beta hydrolase [Planctomycetota bacterium]|jgi:fermentation-respiration switch protein FrsA (DUF1100 family)
MVLLKRIVLWVAGIWLVVTAIAFFFQRQFQYFPAGGPVPRPTGPPYGDLEDVRLEASDGVDLHAWYWPNGDAATILFLHGNAGHRGHRLSWITRFHAMGWGVFILDYRGYGGSSGSPSEEGLYLDAEAAAAFLEERGAGPVVYFGSSVGSGVAVELAVRRPPAALILQGGSTSHVDVARRVYPFLPVGLLLRDRYDALSRIERVTCPLLAIHGTDDEIVPASLGRALFDAAPDPKTWFEVEEAGHNDVPDVGGPAYYAAIQSFLESTIR